MQILWVNFICILFVSRGLSWKRSFVLVFFSPFTRAHKVCSGMGVTLLGLSWKCLNFTLSYLYRVTVPKKRGFTSSWRTHTRLNKWAYLWPLAKVEMFKSEKFSFFLIFNVAVGGNWPGSPNANTQFPQRMLVDYVRVFSKNEWSTQNNTQLL